MLNNVFYTFFTHLLQGSEHEFWQGCPQSSFFLHGLEQIISSTFLWHGTSKWWVQTVLAFLTSFSQGLHFSKHSCKHLWLSSSKFVHPSPNFAQGFGHLTWNKYHVMKVSSDRFGFFKTNSNNTYRDLLNKVISVLLFILYQLVHSYS